MHFDRLQRPVVAKEKQPLLRLPSLGEPDPALGGIGVETPVGLFKILTSAEGIAARFLDLGDGS